MALSPDRFPGTIETPLIEAAELLTVRMLQRLNTTEPSDDPDEYDTLMGGVLRAADLTLRLTTNYLKPKPPPLT
ncbi:hypothetical protein HYW41_04205 [Candidatus Daviesbacteria bacterium]|nr:hypothetical protein [Candidatus Daviesbacteria bacterium]